MPRKWSFHVHSRRVCIVNPFWSWKSQPGIDPKLGIGLSLVKFGNDIGNIDGQKCVILDFWKMFFKLLIFILTKILHRNKRKMKNDIWEDIISGQNFVWGRPLLKDLEPFNFRHWVGSPVRSPSSIFESKNLTIHFWPSTFDRPVLIVHFWPFTLDTTQKCSIILLFVQFRSIKIEFINRKAWIWNKIAFCCPK